MKIKNAFLLILLMTSGMQSQLFASKRERQRPAAPQQSKWKQFADFMIAPMGGERGAPPVGFFVAIGACAATGLVRSYCTTGYLTPQGCVEASLKAYSGPYRSTIPDGLLSATKAKCRLSDDERMNEWVSHEWKEVLKSKTAVKKEQTWVSIE